MLLDGVKACKKCGETKPLTDFHKWKYGKDGLKPHCKPCNTRSAVDYAQRNAEKTAERVSQWQKENRDKANANQKRWLEQNKDVAKERGKVYRARGAEREKLWVAANIKKLRAVKAAWKKRNPHKGAADTRRRFAQKLAATPAWADHKAIEQYYLLAWFLSEELGVPHHVDHVVPLRSDAVCGLHTHTNMSVLIGAWNISKGNRHWPDMP